MLKIVQNSKIYVGLALVLVVVSIASLLIQGFALDTDFAGGTAITYTISEKVTEDEVKALVKEVFGKEIKKIKVQACLECGFFAEKIKFYHPKRQSTIQNVFYSIP